MKEFYVVCVQTCSVCNGDGRWECRDRVVDCSRCDGEGVVVNQRLLKDALKELDICIAPDGCPALED